MTFLKCKIRFMYVGFNCKRKKWGGRVGRLMANAILNFHFDYPHPSLTKNLNASYIYRQPRYTLQMEQSNVREKRGIDDSYMKMQSHLALSCFVQLRPNFKCILCSTDQGLRRVVVSPSKHLRHSFQSDKVRVHRSTGKHAGLRFH